MNTYQVRAQQSFAQASLRGVKGSYRKANLVMDLIRSKPAVKALYILEYTFKRHAKPALLVLKSALENAQAKGINTSELYIRHAYATKAHQLKRVEFKGRGRTGMICKPYSHITITVGPKQEQKSKQKVIKLELDKGAKDGSKK